MEHNVVFDNYENGLKFSDIMELHTFNNVSDGMKKCHKSCPGCDVKCILDHIMNANHDDDLPKDSLLDLKSNLPSKFVLHNIPNVIDDDFAKEVLIDTENDVPLKKSDSLCNLLHLNDSQAHSAEVNYKQSDIYNRINSHALKKTHVSSKDKFILEKRLNESISNPEKVDKNKTESDQISNEMSSRNSQIITARRLSHIRSSTESLLFNTPNKLKTRRSVSKTTLVSKFLESIDNKVDLKSEIKTYIVRKPCSLYIKDVKIDRHLQDTTNNQILREVSISSVKSKLDLSINAKLENFLHSQTLIYPDEKIYKVFKALDLNGVPLLMVLTDHSIYLLSTGTCCCTFKLLYAIWYDKLAAVVIGPFCQLVIFVNKMNKKLYAVNTAAVYDSAREFAMFAEIAIRRWSYVNSKELFFSAVQIDNYYRMKYFHDLMSDNILPKEEEILFLTWVWLQEEYMDVSPLGPQKEGYVMFKGGACLSWVPSYIRLKGGVLYVFDNAIDRVPKQAIELAASHSLTCRCSVQCDRPYSFEIIRTSNNNNNNNAFLFGTANETEMREWSEILVSVNKGLASCYDDEKEASVSGCYLLMTSSRLVAYAYPNRVLNHCRLDDIVSFKRTNKCRDLYCLMEFGCREALEGAGDWIVHFVSKKTNDIFCAQLEEIKPNLFLEIESVIENESLINRCRRVNFKLQSMWDPFFTNNNSSRNS